MQPISGRVPDDLFDWLSTAQLDDAVTMSDKLRLAITALKRTRTGQADLGELTQFYRDNTQSSRACIGDLELSSGVHSEVLATFTEHLPVLLAMLQAARPTTPETAAQLENALVKRTFQLLSALLRQAFTQQASAFDSQVLHNHLASVLELVQLIHAKARSAA